MLGLFISCNLAFSGIYGFCFIFEGGGQPKYNKYVPSLETSYRLVEAMWLDTPVAGYALATFDHEFAVGSGFTSIGH